MRRYRKHNLTYHWHGWRTPRQRQLGRQHAAILGAALSNPAEGIARLARLGVSLNWRQRLVLRALYRLSWRWSTRLAQKLILRLIKV